MPRESVQQKGRRYVTEGRLNVQTIEEGLIEAVCRGQGHEYRLGWHGGAWHCTCSAKGVCAHLVALQLVTVAP